LTFGKAQAWRKAAEDAANAHKEANKLAAQLVKASAKKALAEVRAARQRRQRGLLIEEEELSCADSSDEEQVSRG